MSSRLRMFSAREMPPAGENTFQKPGMMALDPTSNWLFSGRSFAADPTSTGIARVDRTTMEFEEIPTIGVNHPHAIGVSTNGKWVLSASLDLDNTIDVIDAATGDLVDQLVVTGSTLAFVQFGASPDGTTVVVTSQVGGKLLFFQLDPDTGELTEDGEVAVVDLDAAMGNGSNAPIIRELVRQAPCRVGGGIRDIDTALAWLDVGAERVVIGTAASVDFCSQLPRDRVIAAVDAEAGRVVVEGWQTKTEHGVIDRITELTPVVGGFLLTQVEYEGGMSGWNEDLVAEAVQAAGSVRITAAGGITTPEDVGRLDQLGADAQVGMALYTNRMSLGEAVGAPLVKAIDGRLWPTVVCDEEGHALGLVWSTRESLEAAVRERRGIYWSRSRDSLWIKGETSGATQELLRVELDCDRDALRFVVRQQGSGFCHTGTPGCWPTPFTLSTLSDVIARRGQEAPEGSGTAKLMGDPALLASKLREETEELIRTLQIADAGSEHVSSDDARTEDSTEPAKDVIHEAADLLYFTLVAAASRGAGVDALRRELAQRSLRVRRRPMTAKPDEARSDEAKPDEAHPDEAKSDGAKPDDGENR
ncbi:MAG: hypothetical protein IH921_05655 [Gemmatimonadetes bacterium]|nr:hypothetical protein [Gemmatimonadota bacterium]